MTLQFIMDTWEFTLLVNLEIDFNKKELPHHGKNELHRHSRNFPWDEKFIYEIKTYRSHKCIVHESFTNNLFISYTNIGSVVDEIIISSLPYSYISTK